MVEDSLQRVDWRDGGNTHLSDGRGPPAEGGQERYNGGDGGGCSLAVSRGGAGNSCSDALAVPSCHASSDHTLNITKSVMHVLITHYNICDACAYYTLQHL